MVSFLQFDAWQWFPLGLTLPVALFGLDECRKLRTGPLDFMRRVMGPMLLLRFFALPAPLLLAGAPLYWAAVANLALADALSNIHSFIIIATNLAIIIIVIVIVIVIVVIIVIILNYSIGLERERS